MILPDINLLVYAHSGRAPLHEVSRIWWEGLIERDEPVGLPWVVVFGFVRLMTHPALLEKPITPAAAIDAVESWLAQPSVQILECGPRHLEIVRRLFENTAVGGNLATDTHLAALAIEHQCELHSNDADFARFPGLRWRNPLARK